MSRYNIHSLEVNDEQAYATFVYTMDGKDTLYGVAIGDRGVANIAQDIPSLQYRCFMHANFSGVCEVFTEEHWLYEHTMLFAFTCSEWDYIASREYYLDLQTEELVSIYEIEHRSETDYIGTHMGMGVRYVGLDFFESLFDCIDIAADGEKFMLLFAIGD